MQPTSCFFPPSSSFLFLFLTLAAAVSSSAVILAPNMSSCHLPYLLPADETPFDCCAPSAHDYAPRLFTPKFNSSSSPLRVRRPAHSVSVSYAEKLARAYALMKALPPDDPRSFLQQANIHCAYCNEVYQQMNSTQLFQIHGSWLFLPFHRWYLYFHERILVKLLVDDQKLLADDDFALPFWNYDHPDGAAIPPLYSTYNLTLVDFLRDTHHNATAPAAIDYAGYTDSRSQEKQLRENANAMFRSLVRDATSQENFFGGPYRAGESSSARYGTVEGRPHNSVHRWVGQKSQVGWKDMGTFYAAARDPLFYAHHALIDRLWEVWRGMPGNYDIEDEDYLDAEFAFYNEEAELVRVRVGDALNTTELGYVYEEVENVWEDARPERRSKGEAKLRGNESMCVEGEEIRGPCTMVMERDAEGARGKEEYMEIRMEYAANEESEIDIYINLPSADAETDTGCEEYYDYLTILPAFLGMGGEADDEGGNAISTFKAKAIMGERLAALELSEAASLVVTLVPHPHNASAAYLSLLSASILFVNTSIPISTS